MSEKIVQLNEEVIKGQIKELVYDARSMQPENARSNNVELQVDDEKLAMPEFKALWSKINAKSVYVVDFDTDELIRKAITSPDSKLHVSKIHFRVETGAMDVIKSKEELLSGASFVKEESDSYNVQASANASVKYDLIGKLVDETGLTRKAIYRVFSPLYSTSSRTIQKSLSLRLLLLSTMKRLQPLWNTLLTIFWMTAMARMCLLCRRSKADWV